MTSVKHKGWKEYLRNKEKVLAAEYRIRKLRDVPKGAKIIKTFPYRMVILDAGTKFYSLGGNTFGLYGNEKYQLKRAAICFIKKGTLSKKDARIKKCFDGHLDFGKEPTAVFYDPLILENMGSVYKDVSPKQKEIIKTRFLEKVLQECYRFRFDVPFRGIELQRCSPEDLVYETTPEETIDDLIEQANMSIK